MGLRNRVSIRLLAGLLLFGALWVGVTDLSHAATIGYLDAGEAGRSTTPLPASIDRVEDQAVWVDGASALASKANSTPQFQTGGLSAITRAILHIRYCVCSGVHQLLASSSPVSTESHAPVTPIPAAPAAIFLFMAGLVTVAGVARRSHSGFIPSLRASLPVETPRIPIPGYLLFVSDDARFVHGLANCFIRYGYLVESVLNTAQAESLAAQQAPALVLLDRRQSGWQMLRQASPFQTLPMMTIVPAGLGVTDEACADDLESGIDCTHICDENSRLLVAKTRALLRRSEWLEQAPMVVRAGQVELDVDRCEVRVAGQAHHLPPVQFKLLKRLMESPGKVFRRQELLDHIWGEGYAVEGHTLDVHICWLRRLLAHDQTRGQTIATIRGVGVKFVVEPISDDLAPACDALVREKRARRSSTRPRIGRSASRISVRPSVAVHTTV
jgi:DNA-binding response OmpR family regulator